MSQKAKELDLKLLSLIQKGMRQPHDDIVFNDIALDLYEYQFLNNKPYQNYCKNIKRTPDRVSNWKEIPAIPTSVFKETILTCFPHRKAQKIFYTSGTTLKKTGRHYLENLDLYEHSLLASFKDHFTLENKHWSLLILTPSPEEMPHSSLCHMMGVLEKTLGTEKDPYFIKGGRFLFDRFKKNLEKFSILQKPVILLGTAFSFVHFLDHAAQNKWNVHLPKGSRIMETGGYKGKSREMSRSKLYRLIQKILGVPRNHIINEYGMTEMGSQFYDNTLMNIYRGEKKPIFKEIPPWVRTQVLNPLTLEEQPPGETGLLQHYDLANRSSVMALLTEDIGIRIKEGFEILGRAPQAEPRGCSIGAEEWVTQH